MSAEIDKKIEDFMSVTGKKNVAVIVPIYGEWSDKEGAMLNGDVLHFVLERLDFSRQNHMIYELYVTDPRAIQTHTGKERTIANVLGARNRYGNTKFLPVKKSDPYVESIRVGMEYALEETNAEFIVILNPWVLIQHGALDVIVDRANRGDTAKIISGFDLRSEIEPEALDEYKMAVPKEEYNISFNFMGMPRFIAQMLALDPELSTHEFMERDIWQRMFKEGYAAITTQRVPIFPFDFPWKEYESEEQYETDKQHFIQKWGFDPGTAKQQA